MCSKLADDFADLVADRARVDVDVIVNAGQLAQQRLGDLAVGRNDDLAGLGVDHIERDFFAEEDVRKRLGELLVQFVLPLRVFFLDRLGLALASRRGELLARATSLRRGDLHVHDDAIGAGGNGERGVLHVRGLLAENGAQEALFGREFGLALRRDLADEDVAGLHLRADADDAVGAEIAQGFLADVRDVPGDFLGPELGVAGADLELVDVDGGIDVLLDDLLGDQ